MSVKKKMDVPKKKKTYGLLIMGAILLIAGIIFAVYAYNTSYQDSLPVGKQLSEVKAQISAVKEGTEDGDLDAAYQLGQHYFRGTGGAQKDEKK